jgi:hypothetical protein
MRLHVSRNAAYIITDIELFYRQLRPFRTFRCTRRCTGLSPRLTFFLASSKPLETLRALPDSLVAPDRFAEAGSTALD